MNQLLEIYIKKELSQEADELNRLKREEPDAAFQIGYSNGYLNALKNLQLRMGSK